MILLRLSLILVMINLINASEIHDVKQYLTDENYHRVISYNSTIDNLTVIRDCFEVGGSVLQQAALACFAIGHSEWFKSSPFGSLNLIFFGSVATVVQACCLTITRVCNQKVTNYEAIVEELLEDHDISSQAFDVLRSAKPKSA